MGIGLLIVFGVFVACALFAFVGARIGGKMEEKALGAGTTEAEMRSAWTANTLGGLLGMIPFLVFVIALVVTIIRTPQVHHDDGSGAPPAAAAAH